MHFYRYLIGFTFDPQRSNQEHTDLLNRESLQQHWHFENKAIINDHVQFAFLCWREDDSKGRICTCKAVTCKLSLGCHVVDINDVIETFNEAFRLWSNTKSLRLWNIWRIVCFECLVSAYKELLWRKCDNETLWPVSSQKKTVFN